MALLSLIVGVIASSTSLLLEITVRKLQDFIIGYEHNWYFYVVFPAIGIMLSVLVVKYFYRGNLEKGVSSVIHDIVRRNSRVKHSKVSSNIITSALTVGLGGSCGLEGPVVSIGSGIGAIIGMRNHLNYRERTLLLACGGAAAISAVFNAPITGLIFAIEILLVDVLVSNILFVMLASAVGMLMSQFSGQKHLLINATRLNLTLSNIDMLLLIVLSFITSLYCLYYVRLNAFIVKNLDALDFKPISKALVGGMLLFTLIIFFPLLFGEGYHTIQNLVEGNNEVLFYHSFVPKVGSPTINLIVLLLGSLLFKVFATSITIHSGGNGGYFAPSLFVGAVLGYLFAYIINLTGLAQVNTAAFTLIGMAGTLSGIMFSPLTAVFLIAEVTGGYALFVPLMLVSSFSFFFVRHFDPNVVENRSSVFDSSNADSKTEHPNITVDLNSIIDNEIFLLPEHATMEALILAVKKSRRNLYGIVNDAQILIGTIHFYDIKDYIIDQKFDAQYSIKKFIKKATISIHDTDSASVMLSKFEQSDVWYLPMYKGELFIGFVSKKKLLTALKNVVPK